MISTVNSDTLRLSLPHTPQPSRRRRLAISVLVLRIRWYSTVMTSIPSLARLASGTRHAFHVARIIAVLVLAFPVGVIAALLRTPFLLAPAIPDCLRMMVILPIVIPFLAAGSSMFAVYWVVRKTLSALAHQVSRLSSRKTRAANAVAGGLPVTPSADLERVLAKEPLSTDGSPLPRTPMRISIPPASSYPSPPLTESSRNSSICFESPGPLTPAPISPRHVDYSPAVVAAQLDSATEKLRENYIEDAGILVLRLPDSSVPASQYISDVTPKLRQASRVRAVRFHLHDDNVSPLRDV